MLGKILQEYFFYFDIFTNCNMIANKAVFIALCDHSTILLPIFVILFTRSLWLIYYTLQVFTLKYHHPYLSTLPFYSNFYRFNCFRFLI